MNEPSDNPYAHLERIFHEPWRLTIMTNLLGAPNGLTFTELKAACNLTDGNLGEGGTYALGFTNPLYGDFDEQAGFQAPNE